MNKLIGIQYLRGFAAMYVMIFHLGSLTGVEITANGGRTARLFFVISGFIITWSFRRNAAQSPALQLKNFAIRRAARIYPPYWVIYALTLPLFLLGFGEGAWWHRDPVNIVQNFFLTQPAHQNIVPVSWTLVFEIFFYCLYGLGVIFLGIPVTIVGGVWAAVILGFHFLAPDYFYRFVITYEVNLYFIGGCFLAELHRKKPIEWGKPIFAILLITYTVLPFFTEHDAPDLILSILLVASGLSAFPGKPNKFFLLLGEASYSIYLAHGLVAIILFRLGHGKMPYFLLLALTFGSVMAFYYLVELPLMKVVRTSQGKKVLTPTEIKIAPVP